MVHEDDRIQGIILKAADLRMEIENMQKNKLKSFYLYRNFWVNYLFCLGSF